MKILFGQVPKEFEDEHDNFSTDDGKQFYYQLDVTEEANINGHFSIEDTCGRSLPFDFEQLDELVEVLSTLKDYRDGKKRFINFWNNIWSGR